MPKLSKNTINRLQVNTNPEKQNNYYLAMINNTICELIESIKELRASIEQDQNPINPVFRK